MSGNFIDTFRMGFKRVPANQGAQVKLVETDYGNLRVLDTQGYKPVIINVPDGPNVIEHHEELIKGLATRFRVICFEFPGFGFSYPSSQYDYSLHKSADLLLNLMDILKVDKAALSFSCSNGFYAMKAIEKTPERFNHLFLAQTPSMHAMRNWAANTIPSVLTLPVIGQLANSFLEKKFARSWYKYALPKGADVSDYKERALYALNNGGCFCLSGLVQGLRKDSDSELNVTGVPATMVWGSKDFTHTKTDSQSIRTHLPGCEIIAFDHCGHFPELEDTKNYVSLLNERLG